MFSVVDLTREQAFKGNCAGEQQRFCQMRLPLSSGETGGRLVREVNSGTKIAEFRRSLVGQIMPSALQPAESIMRYDYGSAGFGISGEDATDFPNQ